MRRAETGGVLRGDVGRTDGRVWEYGQSDAGEWREFRVSNGGGDGGMIGARGVECGGRERRQEVEMEGGRWMGRRTGRWRGMRW